MFLISANHYGTPHQQLKNKKHIIISTDAGKTLDQTQHPFIIKTPESGHRGNIPQHNKGHGKSTGNILNSEKMKACPLRSEIRQGHFY